MAASQGISDLWSGAEVAEAAEWHLLFSVVLIQTRNVDFIKTFFFSLGYSITRVPEQQKICIEIGDKEMLWEEVFPSQRLNKG